MTDLDNFPRVLVIAPVKFNRQTGSGVTMSNLFYGWPKDRLAQIHSEAFTEANKEVCENYYHLPYIGVRQDSIPKMALETFKQAWRFSLQQQDSFAGHWLHDEKLMEWVKEFQPQLIYCRLSERPSFFVWMPPKLAHELRIPYVTRMLDDWPSKLDHDKSLFRRLLWKLVIRKQLKGAFRGADANIAISQEMCEAFKKRYRCEFIPFSNCIDPQQWNAVEKDYHSGEVFKIVYLGTVSREKELYSLLDIANIIKRMTSEGEKIRLTIYGPDIYYPMVQKYLENPPLVIYGGFFPEERKVEILSEADLLILPVNFDKESQRYVGYSFQTKVPEYMASGTPTLVYGPPSNPNIRYAKKEKWGYVVDRRDFEALKTALFKLMHEADLRERLGETGRVLAFQNHNAERVRNGFQQMLINIAWRNQSVSH